MHHPTMTPQAVTPISIITVGARYRMLFDRNHPNLRPKYMKTKAAKAKRKSTSLKR